jgi:hypothetical protein
LLQRPRAVGANAHSQAHLSRASFIPADCNGDASSGSYPPVRPSSGTDAFVVDAWQQNNSWLSNDVLHMFEFHSFSLMAGEAAETVSAAGASDVKTAAAASSPVFTLLRHIFPAADVKLLTLLQK